ncbi:MAG: DUF167 domain-containing protein [Thermoplasmata archaeon]|jgi:uncharacterized protein YggU (UPF0235/DUF167 family)
MIIRVRVNFGNGNTEMINDTLIVYTDKKPENNRANIDVMKKIAEYFDTDIKNVKLIKGRKSRNKEFEILK